MKITFGREFYIPKNSERIDGPCGAVVYVARELGKIRAMGFGGKRSKPDWHYVFRTEEQMQGYVKDHFNAEQSRADYKAKRNAEHAANRATTPADVYAKACKDRSISDTDAAVCLRAVLARTWPGTKFSVRTDRSLNVYWTDGPSVKDVDAIAHNYSFEGFDGMIDMRYGIDRWLSRDGSMSLAHTSGTAGSMGVHGEAMGDPHAPDAVMVSGGPDFVFCHREISEPVKRQLTTKVCRMFGITVPEPLDNLERFLNTTLTKDGEYLCQLVYQASTGALKLA